MDESLGWVLVIEDFVESVCSPMSLFSFFKRSQLQSQMRQESRVHPVLLDSNMEGTPVTNMSLQPLFDHWICYSCIRVQSYAKPFKRSSSIVNEIAEIWRSNACEAVPCLFHTQPGNVSYSPSPASQTLQGEDQVGT
ncbi:hypothetical protein C4D60_Mb05t16000 [Musa balbisiana]|uniref:Uncharacterized protein n=1 Tax=Musa balbisiana TaxID=52838 RepID=A0A4S8JWG6_MUSBA|nr:hypothetical protein C4D60_Mb05t16000 [Musa balbisiana]